MTAPAEVLNDDERIFVELAKSLGLEPRELMNRYLQRFAKLLDCWAYDDTTADEMLLIRTAALHIRSALHSLEMLTPSLEAWLVGLVSQEDDDVGPRCGVCGHFHGGQGSCITAHAFVAARDCPTCVAAADPLHGSGCNVNRKSYPPSQSLAAVDGGQQPSPTTQNPVREPVPPSPMGGA